MASVLAPFFGAIGVALYQTKPIAMAVRAHLVSICTYLQGSLSLTYPRVLDAVVSREKPQAYTTIKAKKQLDENLMGVLRTRKASPLPRDHSPVNWYAAPLCIDWFPCRFPWSQETLRKIIRASTRASTHEDPLDSIKFITFPNRYWKEPVGLPRACPVGRVPDCLNYQLQHLDVARVPAWIEGAAQVRQRNLRCRVTPLKQNPVWQPQGIMTMYGDKLFVIHDSVNTVLGFQARAKWGEQCLEIEIASFPNWKRTCELWNSPGWVSKRIALEVDSRAETARQQAFVPVVPTPTMAMSLDPQVTIALPTHELEAEPMSPRTTQNPTGEHAVELTPDALLVQPIADLTLPEDFSDSETVKTVVPPRRRTSVPTQNGETPDETTRERARRSSAQ